MQKRSMAIKTDQIAIEVVYALPANQALKCFNVPDGTTIEQAIALSGIIAQFPEIDVAKNKFGIFGQLANAETVLRHQDRIEIYRPLIIDPKEARRKRAAM